MTSLADIVRYLDGLLRIPDIPDYPNAVNGVQVGHRGPVVRVATAVDASLQTIRATSAIGANLLLVHHGLFWSGLQPQTGRYYERLRHLVEHDIAVYAAHLPLDVHETFGNSRLLAAELGLEVHGRFAAFRGVHCGVSGRADVPTETLIAAAGAFASRHRGRALATACPPGRRTRQWAICSGSGADASFLEEAEALGVDTLIVGEGPHWSAVEAPERGMVIIYAGHYATETLGVATLGNHLAATFGLPHDFIAAPTGL